MSDVKLSAAAEATLVLLYLNGPQTLSDLPTYDAYDELTLAGLTKVTPQAEKAYGLNREGLERATNIRNVQLMGDLVSPIVDEAFTLATAVEQSGHDTLVAMEDHIMLKLDEIHPDGQYRVRVTVGFGKVVKFTTEIRNMKTGVVHTQENISGEEPVVKPTLNMAQRSNVAIDLTKAIRDTLADKFLEAEYLCVGEAINHIYDGLIAKLDELVPTHECHVTVEVTPELLATVVVEVPGVTKVRLRATRKPIQQEATNAV